MDDYHANLDKTMTKRSNQKPSPETQEEAERLAKATQRPNQTKEQTKLIAQGIQKGIELYKKQHKEKSRDLNRKIKKISELENRHSPVAEYAEEDDTVTFVYRQHWLPWVLLAMSWLGFGGYLLFGSGSGI